MADAEIERLQAVLRAFSSERDWDQFHTPKNLAMALAVETAELLEIFQWLTPGESAELSDELLDHAKDEIADIFGYLLRLADVLSIDVVASLDQKIQENAKRYPIELSRGSAHKAPRAGET